MNKNSTRIIIFSVFFAFLFNLFFGRFLSAKISTWPILNRFKILSPDAPIVINNREEIRLTDAGLITDSVNAAKSKISSVYLKVSDQLKQTGSAVNLSSDGSFVAYKGTFQEKGEYFVVLQDGRNAKIQKVFSDAGSDLVFFTANLYNVPVAPLGDSKSLMSGEKVVFFQNHEDSFEVWPDYVAVTEGFKPGTVFYAGKAENYLKTSNQQALDKGLVVLNIKGEVVGLSSGENIVPADVIKNSMMLFLNSKTGIFRPDFDFSYKEISATQAAILGIAHDPVVATAGKTSQLKPGDAILAVNGQPLTAGANLQDSLSTFKAGESVVFKVMRNSQVLDLTIVPKELK